MSLLMLQLRIKITKLAPDEVKKADLVFMIMTGSRVSRIMNNSVGMTAGDAIEHNYGSLFILFF